MQDTAGDLHLGRDFVSSTITEADGGPIFGNRCNVAAGNYNLYFGLRVITAADGCSVICLGPDGAACNVDEIRAAVVSAADAGAIICAGVGTGCDIAAENFDGSAEAVFSGTNAAAIILRVLGKDRASVDLDGTDAAAVASADARTVIVCCCMNIAGKDADIACHVQAVAADACAVVSALHSQLSVLFRTAVPDEQRGAPGYMETGSPCPLRLRSFRRVGNCLQHFHGVFTARHENEVHCRASADGHGAAVIRFQGQAVQCDGNNACILLHPDGVSGAAEEIGALCRDLFPVSQTVAVLQNDQILALFQGEDRAVFRCGKDAGSPGQPVFGCEDFFIGCIDIFLISHPDGHLTEGLLQSQNALRGIF